MEAHIQRRFNPAVLRDAADLYGVAPSDLRPLDGFESFIYEFERGEDALILRLGHSSRRSVTLVQGEIDWLNYLAAGGATVTPAAPSLSGAFVHEIADGHGDAFVVVAFMCAPGRAPTQTDWTPTFVTRYGRMLGRLHALSRRYVPARPTWRRPDWDDPIMLDVERHLGPEDQAVRTHYLALRRHLATLPRAEADYGLIHQDAHAGNFFVDDAGTLTLFDFDDCAYSWFANDIAIVLFYAVLWEADPATFTDGFMRAFLAGYRSQHRLDPAWLAQMPHFLKLREIDLYAVIRRSFDVTHLTDPWVAGYMRGRRERLVSGQPTIGFPFATLADALV